jgi:hypothetical protein
MWKQTLESPQGDGDQTRIDNPEHQQFYREIFSQGGDLAECFGTPGFISEFGTLCALGDVPRVKALLEAADAPDLPHPSRELTELLETRETSMRLTPLLMTVSVGKNIEFGNDSAELGRNQLKVAELLLEYGARPDAKDVTGKTVCHYGAGVMATKTTMKIVERAAKAYETSHLFDQEVELTDLTDESKNGSRGFARGFQSACGRRAVFLCDEGKQVAIKPKNIKLIGGSTSTTFAKRNLCDVQCRLGVTSIMETAMSNRVDVAEFLGNKMGASLDIKDCDGMDARTMAMSGGAEMMAPAVSAIKNVARKRANEAAKSERRKCANCDKPEPKDQKFEVCSRCKAIRYCTRDCQGKSSYRMQCKDNALNVGIDSNTTTISFVSVMLQWNIGRNTRRNARNLGFRKLVSNWKGHRPMECL